MKDQSIVWPWPIRLIHWTIAIAVILNMYIIGAGDPPHRYLGYVAAGLVLVRFFFGFYGKGHVKFSSMPLSLKSIKENITGHFKKTPVDYVGHNPLASIVYLLMWFFLIALGITGWMFSLDAFFGDDNLEAVHVAFSNALQVLVVIHFAGILIDAIHFKRKTWMAMIVGRK